MYLLLQSPSEVARITLAQKIVSEHTDWRHIPIDRIVDFLGLDDADALGLTVQPELLLQLACQCAKKLEKEEGFHTVLSCENIGDVMEDVFSDLGDGLYAIHLGEDNEDAAVCDYIIEPTHSVNEAFAMVEKLIKAVLAQAKKQGKARKAKKTTKKPKKKQK